MTTDWNKLRASAEVAQQQRNLPEAERCWRAALYAAERFDEHDRRVALTLEGLAEVLWHQSKFNEATECCNRLYKIYEKVFGPDQLDVGVIANNLAMLYHVQEKTEEAERFYKIALDIKTIRLGANHPEISKLRGNYANLLKQLNRHAEAEQLKSGATIITAGQWTKGGSEGQSERNDGSAADSTEGSAAPKTAAPAGSRPEGTTSTAGSNGAPRAQARLDNYFSTPQTVIGHWETLRQIAEECSKAGDLGRAEGVWAAALAFLEPFADKDARRYAYTLDALADNLFVQGKMDVAEPLYVRSLEVKTKNLGEHHVIVAKSLNNLAKIYYQCNRFSEAEPLTKRCVDIYAKIFGREHPDYATALHNLGTLYHIQLRFKEAEPLYRQALTIRNKALGPSHPETEGLARSLANLLRSTGRADEADRLHGPSSAVITGTWRALTIPEDQQLLVTEG